MRNILKLILVTMIMATFGKNIQAQGGATAVPFLLLAPDSRAGGIGESGGGLADNSAAIFWNPAGIAFLSGSEVNFTHSNWLPEFNLADLYYEYFAYRQYMPSINGSVTTSVVYMNFGEFIRTDPSGQEIGKFNSFDLAVTLGYSTKISSDWGVGFNFRLIHSKLSDEPTAKEEGRGVATSVSFDVAVMWRPEKLELPLIGDIGKKFSMGINLSNLGPKIWYLDKEQADPIPTNFRLGFAYKIFEDEYSSLTYTLDFSKLLVGRRDKDSIMVNGKKIFNDNTNDLPEFYEAIFTAWGDQSFGEELRDINTSMGLEYWYGLEDDFMFTLRTGFFYEDPGYGNRKFVTFGAGIRYDMYGFDFSYISTSVFPDGDKHPLSETLRFTIMIGWNGGSKITHSLPRGI